MEAIAQLLIFILIIWANIALSKRNKLKRKKDLLDEGKPDSRMEELRQRVREIRANAYWQHFRDNMVPPELLLEEEQYIEERGKIKPPLQEAEILEESIPEIIREDSRKRESFIFGLGKTEMQRGIILAEILSPCIAKRGKGIRRI